MNAVRPFPKKVRLLIPVLGAKIDGEALGACRAIGRVLDGAGLDFHGLAAAIPTDADRISSEPPERAPAWPPQWDGPGWREASMRPPPPYQPSRRKPHAFTPRQEAQHRAMVSYCHLHGEGRLSPKERAFLRGISGLRGNISFAQSTWLGDLTARLQEEGRAPC